MPPAARLGAPYGSHSGGDRRHRGNGIGAATSTVAAGATRRPPARPAVGPAPRTAAGSAPRTGIGPARRSPPGTAVRPARRPSPCVADRTTLGRPIAPRALRAAGGGDAPGRDRERSAGAAPRTAAPEAASPPSPGTHRRVAAQRRRDGRGRRGHRARPRRGQQQPAAGGRRDLPPAGRQHRVGPLHRIGGHAADACAHGVGRADADAHSHADSVGDALTQPGRGDGDRLLGVDARPVRWHPAAEQLQQVPARRLPAGQSRQGARLGRRRGHRRVGHPDVRRRADIGRPARRHAGHQPRLQERPRDDVPGGPAGGDRGSSSTRSACHGPAATAAIRSPRPSR